MKILLRISVSMLFAIAAWAQPQSVWTVRFTDPTGLACSAGSAVLYGTTGGLFSCQSGVYATVGGGSGTFNALSGDATSTATGGATTVLRINGTSFAGTSGHLVSFGAANIPADSGVVAANVTTSAASLTSTAIVTGGGSQALQTPSATATLDASGNLSTPGSITAASFSTSATAFSAAGSEQSLATACPGSQTYDKLFYSSANHIPQFCLGSGTTVMATTLVPASSATSHQWIDYIPTTGTPHTSQPAFTDVSGSVASTQMPALTGDATTSAGAIAVSLAAPFKVRTCEIVIGGTGASNVLQTGDDAIAGGSCYNGTGVTITITGVYCIADTGTTTTVTPIVHGGGTILTGALSCGNNAWSSTGTLSGTPTLASAGSIDGAITAVGTAHSVHIAIKYTVPNA